VEEATTEPSKIALSDIGQLGTERCFHIVMSVFKEYFHFHFIDPTGALNIKRNFNTIVLVSTHCFKNTSDFSSKNFF
jgi:hypothetical protein